MKKTFKRVVTGFVCLTLIASLFGCGSNKNSDTGTDASTVAAESSSTEGDKTSQSKPPVTLKIYMAEAAEFSPGVQEDPVAKEIEKKLNIKMDIETTSSMGDYNTKLSALAASGTDLPDLFYVPNDDKVMKMLIQSGSLLELDELVKSNGQDIIKNASLKLNYMKNVKSFGTNKLYFINLYGDTQGDPRTPLIAPYIRWDLYKQMGYPKIENQDDLLNVLVEMQKKFPTTADNKKVYALSGWFGDGLGWAEWQLFTLDFLSGYSGNAGDWMAYDIETNEAQPNQFTDKQSIFWKNMKWLNTAYQKGVLDPDSPTMKYDQYIEKIKAGKVLCVLGNWMTGLLPGAENGIGYAPVPPSASATKQLVYFNQSTGQIPYAISQNSKYPDRAMDLLNFVCTLDGAELMWNGVQGVSWDMENGKPKLKQEVIDAMKGAEANAYRVKTGYAKYSHFVGFGDLVVDSRYDMPVNFSLAKELVPSKLNNVEKDYCSYYNYSYPGEPFDKIKTHIYDQGISNCVLPMPEDIQAISTKIGDYKHNNIIKVIISKTDADFNKAQDKFIEDVKALGVEKAYEWNINEYKKAKDLYNTLSTKKFGE